MLQMSPKCSIIKILKNAHTTYFNGQILLSIWYVPMEVFDDSSDHIYHEMCAGHEWTKQQVSDNLDSCKNLY